MTDPTTLKCSGAQLRAAVGQSADGLRQRLTALRQQWAVEGPPPGVSCWWDQRLAELDTALKETP